MNFETMTTPRGVGGGKKRRGGKYKPGLKPRPGEKAGEACEAPGCQRVLSSDWYAQGRSCSSRRCKTFFEVAGVNGKEKVQPLGDVTNGQTAADGEPTVVDCQAHVDSAPCGSDYDCLSDEVAIIEERQEEGYQLWLSEAYNGKAPKIFTNGTYLAGNLLTGVQGEMYATATGEAYDGVHWISATFLKRWYPASLKAVRRTVLHRLALEWRGDFEEELSQAKRARVGSCAVRDPMTSMPADATRV